jgi:pentapeptide MXKDX repeat protein
MKIMASVAVLVAAVLSVVAGAQSSGTTGKGDKMDKMDKMEMKDTTYTGCVEAGSAPGTFALTHLGADDHTGKDAMKKETMGKDTMAKDGMSKDAMAPTTLSLTGSTVDLSKHLGHRVSVTGSAAHGKVDAMGDRMGKGAPAFTVKSVKMVAASCS